MTEQQMSALNCAVNVLRGEGGGYSPAEKASAANELEKLLNKAEESSR